MSHPRKLEKLLGAALMRDEEFRTLLFKDPAVAAKSVGIKLKEEEVAYIKTLDAKKFETIAMDIRHFPNPHSAIWRAKKPKFERGKL